jgi:hypothetical protein
MGCTEEKHTVLITRVFAISVFGLALPTGALTQPPRGDVPGY